MDLMAAVTGVMEVTDIRDIGTVVMDTTIGHIMAGPTVTVEDITEILRIIPTRPDITAGITGITTIKEAITPVVTFTTDATTTLNLITVPDHHFI
jgi:hypothetical protein